MGLLSKTTSEIEEALEKIDNIEVTFDTMFNQKMLSIYPIGAIYMSVSSTSPASLFGGTWEQIQDRFLLAAGSSYAAGATGGEAVHTLTVDEMPQHGHPVAISSQYYNVNPIFWDSSKGSTDNNAWGFGYGTKTDEGTYVTAAYTGGGTAHNNMPPYLAIYVWKRTA